MNLYRITVADAYGEQFVVPVYAPNQYEAVRHIECGCGWCVMQVVSV